MPDLLSPPVAAKVAEYATYVLGTLMLVMAVDGVRRRARQEGGVDGKPPERSR